jgi:hypothetical protein
MKNLSKVVKGISTLKEIKENPFNFIIDLLLSAVVSALVPIPFVGNVVTRYKAQILWAIGGVLLLGVFCVVFIFTLLFNVLPAQKNDSTLPVGLQGSALLKALEGYIETGFTDTDIPSKNPLGGDGFDNSIMTMDYHDPNYHFFDGIHTGIDFVPSNAYYQTNEAYKKTGEIIVFSTMNGKGTYAVDQYGANYVDVHNSQDTLFTRYLHLKTSFISTGQEIQAGQPIGIMGSTGESTGIHLHYEVRINDNGKFVTVDPKKYIH